MNEILGRIRNQFKTGWKHLSHHMIWFFNTPKVMMKTFGIVLLIRLTFSVFTDLWLEYLSFSVIGLALVRPSMVIFLAIDYLYVLEIIIVYGLIHVWIRRGIRSSVVRWILELILLVVFMYGFFLLTFNPLAIRWAGFPTFAKQIYYLFLFEFNQLMSIDLSDVFSESLGLGYFLYSKRLLISFLMPTGVFIRSLRHRNDLHRYEEQKQKVLREHQAYLDQRKIRKFCGPKTKLTRRERIQKGMAITGYLLFQVVGLLIYVMIQTILFIDDNIIGFIGANVLFGMITIGLFVLGRHLVKRSTVHLSNYHNMQLLFENTTTNFIISFVALHIALASFYTYRLDDYVPSLYVSLTILALCIFTLINGVRLLTKIKAKQARYIAESIDEQRTQMVLLDTQKIT